MNPEIKSFANEESLYPGAAEFIITLANDFIRNTGKFVWALSGGNTPNALYKILASKPYSDKVDWKNVYVFWSDERYVPFDDPQSNSHQAMQALFTHIDIPEENIYRVPVSEPLPTAAAAYEETIINVTGHSVPSFDLIMLGLGPDGHTASLFPGTKGLRETSKLVIPVDDENVRPQRISFTYPLINAAKNIMFLVAGADKKNILHQVLNPQSNVSYPAKKIHPTNGNLYWFADASALS